MLSESSAKQEDNEVGGGNQEGVLDDKLALMTGTVLGMILDK
jgi:hypothetical protein